MAGSGRKNGDPTLIAALAGGATVQEAARTAGVSERTVYRRMEADTFRRQLVEARADLIGRAVGVLARVSTAAAATLAGLLKAESESVRLGAARSILELAVKLRESEELEQRIAALEEQTAATPQQGRSRWAS